MSDDAEVNDAVKKLMGIRKYEVRASETVYYAVTVEAHSIEEAWELARSGEVEFSYDSVYDGDHFEIDDVVVLPE